MTDILSTIDSAIDGLCGCDCGRPLDPASASATFATPECQQRWHRRRTNNPDAVRGSTGVAPDPARWRPELVAEDPSDDHWRVLDMEPASYTGRLFATVFESPARDRWHLRLHDGNRYVGVNFAPGADDGRDERLAQAWARLERELTDPRRLAPAGSLAHDAARSLWLDTIGAGPVIFDETHLWNSSRIEQVSAWCAAWVPITQFTDAVASLAEAFSRITATPTAVSGDDEPTDPMARALWLRQHRNTGPAQSQRAPRQINPRRSR
jgi:hypothetical protein